MWDARKSNQGKGDLWAPCPFHQEKTASFHVDDRKGYYYCFGCHAKGDAIGFVRETENVGFMEAVEILAREAGMTMPAPDPVAAQNADRLSELADVMEQAVQFFRLQLNTGPAVAARDYLAGRGLNDGALERWEIGFAPEGWQNLWDHLRGKGVDEDMILACGLAKPSNSGKKPYDTFRNRIMFPIRNPRGRAIAFGGRAMDPNDNAKYLNSPETELFDKGRNLYNFGPARAASGKGAPLVVAEGYMDVIALAEHGFEATVAPLGTAVTEDQLQLLWRISPEPIVALDGDRAGMQAAMRLIDLALPMLGPERSLRFCLMPEGKDPDDVLRSSGAGAMREMLDASLPLVELLWRRETEGQVFDSPERKAALDRRLQTALDRIPDAGLKGHFNQALRDKKWEAFRKPSTPRTVKPGRGRFDAAPGTPRAETKGSFLVAGDASTDERLQEAVVLATLVAHPILIERFESALERMETSLDAHSRVLSALLAGVGKERVEIEQLAGPDALETLYQPRHVHIATGLREDHDSDVAEKCVADGLAKLAAARGARRDVEDAMDEITGLVDEGLTWRLGQAAAARHDAGKPDEANPDDYEIAPNGVKLSRSDRARSEAVFDAIRFDKSGGSGA